MRPTFAKHPDSIEIPDLLSLQTESFDWLVGNPAWREIAGKDAKTGLDEVFQEVARKRSRESASVTRGIISWLGNSTNAPNLAMRGEDTSCVLES